MFVRGLEFETLWKFAVFKGWLFPKIRKLKLRTLKGEEKVIIKKRATVKKE